MQTDFRIVAVARERFEDLFALDDTALAARGARRLVADSKPGFPCRVSLVDADIGETVILTAFPHHSVNSPYQASGPVFVREAAETARLAINEIPALLRHRLLSVRAYDDRGMMKDARVREGNLLEDLIQELLSDPAIAYLHIHNAGPGCYNCSVMRAACPRYT